MYDTLIERPLTQSQFFRLQPSVNLNAQLQPLCSAALVPNVLPRRDEGSGMPCAVIEDESCLE